MVDVPSKVELLQQELDDAYAQLSAAGAKARDLRRRLTAATTALQVCLQSDIPDHLRQQALDALGGDDG